MGRPLIKVLERDPTLFRYNAESGILPVVTRNYDTKLNPFEGAREYQRAVVAAKLQNMFSQPFVAQMQSGALDTPYSMATCRLNVSEIVTGNADGTLCMYNIQTRELLNSFQAHDGGVRGVAIGPDETHVYSCGDDSKVYQWRATQGGDDHGIWDKSSKDLRPLTSYPTNGVCRGIDFSWNEQRFATAGDTVEIFDTSRSDPMMSLSWGIVTSDGYHGARFCPNEPNLLAVLGYDFSILLCDIRARSATARIEMANQSTCAQWNPQNPRQLLTGSTDSNVYDWDVRYFKNPKRKRIGHVRAVNCIDISPSGHEFVTGSDDNQIKLWRMRENPCRDTYHTKRMQEVHSVRYTRDARYIVSGSADYTVRLWRAVGDDRAGIVEPQERQAKAYRKSLIEKYKHMDEVRKVLKSRRLPKFVQTIEKEEHIQLQKKKRKEENQKKHKGNQNMS